MTLIAEDVTFKIKGRVLVHDINMEVKPGKLLAVLGPNGAGKSTLLRMFSGELSPSCGNIVLAGKPLLNWPARERARRIAVLAQQTHVSFALTALEVVMLGREPHLHHGEEERDREIAFLAMEATHVLPLMNRAFPSLSGGEKARVQLARVLAQIWKSSTPATQTSSAG